MCKSKLKMQCMESPICLECGKHLDPTNRFVGLCSKHQSGRDQKEQINKIKQLRKRKRFILL
jgi:hypothetical protein